MRRPGPLSLLVLVTAIWGYTFVPVQDAVAVYPLFGFLAVRFGISALVLAPFALRPLLRMGRAGLVGGTLAGLVLALAYGLQTAGLDLTTVSSTGFLTGLYVLFTPLLALAMFRTPVPAVLWAGAGLSVAGLLLLNGAPGGSAAGNLLVLGNALAQALQIALIEKYAPEHDARALTFLQLSVSFVGFAAVAASRGELHWPHGGTVWYGAIASGVFSGAIGYLIATWVQARTTAARAALVFTLEAPFAALFGVLLADDRLGWAGWTGCAVMLAGILLAEPAAGGALRRLLAPRPVA
jgi:drug/metabolite transporter (DMT)-like permease